MKKVCKKNTHTTYLLDYTFHTDFCARDILIKY